MAYRIKVKSGQTVTLPNGTVLGNEQELVVSDADYQTLVAGQYDAFIDLGDAATRPGATAGKDAYDEWRGLGNTGSRQDFIDYLSGYGSWLRAGNTGTHADFVASIKGLKGDKGDAGTNGINGINGAPGAKGDPGALTLARGSVAITTPSLATNASHETTVALGKGYRLYGLAVDRLSRVRLYGTPAQRTADVARASTTDPASTAGVMLDFVFTADALDVPLAPPVDGLSLADPAVETIPVTITNLGAAGPVTATFRFLTTEA